MSIVSTPLLKSTSFDILSSKRAPQDKLQPKTSTSLRRTSSASSSSTTSTTSTSSVDGKYSYKTCPMCSERLLVRIHGAFVHKWINLHFANRHHEWMHVVVNLH